MIAEREAFLSTIIDSIRDGIIIVNTGDFRIVKANAAFLQALQLKEGDVIGRKCHEITHKIGEPCGPPDHACPMREVVATKEHAFAEHVHYPRSI